MNNKQQKIESLLFYKNEPLNYSWIGKQLGLDESDIKSTAREMLPFYHNRGISLILTEETASLATSPNTQEIITQLENNEDARELSKQALETLAIILYRKKITKSEIDYIRGVNSMFILRNLRMRGLIEKKKNVLDKRSPLYVGTPELFAFLGIHSAEDLEYFDDAQEKLEKINKQYEEEQNQE